MATHNLDEWPTPSPAFDNIEAAIQEAEKQAIADRANQAPVDYPVGSFSFGFRT